MLRDSLADISVPLLQTGGVRISEMFRALVPETKVLFIKNDSTLRFHSNSTENVIDQEELMLVHSPMFKAWNGVDYSIPVSPDIYIHLPVHDSLFSVIEQHEWENDIVWECSYCTSIRPTFIPSSSSTDIVETGVTNFNYEVTHLNSKHSKIVFPIGKKHRFSPVPVKSPTGVIVNDMHVFGKLSSYPFLNGDCIFMTNSDLQNKFDICLSSWLDRVKWNDDHPSCSDHLKLDMNDRNLLFIDPADFLSKTVDPYDSEGQSRWNLSNDTNRMYENPSTVAIVGRNAVEHAQFTKELAESVFPPSMHIDNLRHFHRPISVLLLDRRCYTLRTPLKDRLKEIEEASLRFIPRKESHVSARDGRVIFVEYVEERPCLLNNMGMASEFVTYFRHPTGDDEDFSMPSMEDGTFRYGTVEDEDESPFLTELKPGIEQSTLSNNMYAVPVFRHTIRPTDFLLLTSKSKKDIIYIREIPAVYIAGQIQPKLEVPAPNSRPAGKFMKQRLSVFIARILKTEGRVQISTISEAFQEQSESAIRAELKECAEFQRGGPESGWWTAKPEWELTREIETMVTPEAACCYESMLASKLHLEDLGLSELKTSSKLGPMISRLPRNMLPVDVMLNIEEELAITSWMWTLSFQLVKKGEIVFKIVGPGNPLGTGQGFTYTKAPSRITPDPTATVIGATGRLTGTGNDLRGLPNDELCKMLIEFGMKEENIAKIDRWDRVRLVRDNVTAAVLAGIDTPYAQYARSERNTGVAQRRQFKKDAHRIFVEHCKVLSDPNPPGSKGASIADDFEGELESMMGRDAEILNEEVEARQYTLERSMGLDNLEATAAKVNVRRKCPRTVTYIKKTVIIAQEDGSYKHLESFIDDPQLIDDFIKDQEDAGCRFKDDATSSIDGLTPSRRGKKRDRKRGSKVTKDRQLLSPTRKEVTCSICKVAGHTKSSRRCPSRVSGDKRYVSQDFNFPSKRAKMD